MKGWTERNGAFGFVAFTLLLLTGFRVHGMPFHTYDVDSLVYLSSQIVEGTLGNEYRTNNDFRVWAFKVSKVHLGNFKVGQTIAVTALEYFDVSTSQRIYSDMRSLKNGDYLVLFLDRAKKVFLYDVPTNAEIYWPAPSGVRVLASKKAVGFSQLSNPGPYVATLAGAETNANIPTVKHLREEIHESIPKVEKWRSALNGKCTTNDITPLLAILRLRKNPAPFWPEDFIAQKACEQLVSISNIQALADAYEICPSQQWIIGDGFQTPAGRDFLLSKVADPTLMEENRVPWAQMLGHAGLNTSEHDLSRIARVAAENTKSNPLTIALLDCLYRSVSYGLHGLVKTNQDFMTDSSAASLILKSLLKQTDSEETKYHIDLTLAAFNSFKPDSNQPPVISILNPRNPRDNYNAPAGRLSFQYSIRVLQTNSLIARVAIADAQTGQKWTMPAAIRDLNQPTQGGGTDEVALPTDLPHGHYHVFLEYLDGKKIVGTSHFFDTGL